MNKIIKFGILVFLIALVGIIGFYGFSKFTEKDITLKEIIPAHHHFRLSLIIDGDNIDFGEQKYQEEYIPGACSATLTETPLHFHDGVNHLVHIHWDKITGGQVLKYYGINLIGDDDNVLTYQPSSEIKKTEIPIHGKILPKPSQNSKYWIYRGAENDYVQENVEDFVNQDLETFFKKKSKLTLQREEVLKTSFRYFNKLDVLAHGEDHREGDKDQPQEELKELQNLLGDVVVFVEEIEPTKEQINEKFKNLTPLTPSVCGG